MNDDVFAKINEQTDIVDLVSNYVKLEKRGSNYMGLCPFHDEKTPSFSVSPAKHLALCMGCKKGGSPISFLSQIENIPFMEAAKRLADKCHIELSYNIKEKEKNKYQNLFEITNFAKKYYKMYLNNSLSGVEALNYLHNRGLTDETIELFEIGLAPQERTKLSETLEKKNYNPIDMIESGLIKNGENGNYDLFQNRIVFPICDEDGNVLGFSGRIFNTNDQNKYLNSPESVIFKKGDTLFNLSNCKKEIRRKNRCILVEGQLDCISLYNAGIKEAVCSMGTSLTINQAKLIKSYADNVILAYDGDNAGQNAIYKAKNILKQAGLNVSIVIFENNLDPDEYLKKYGPEKLNYLFDNPVDEYEFMYHYSLLNKDLNNLSQVELIKTKIFNIIKEANSEVIKDKFLKRLSNEINVSLDVLITDFQKYNNINYIEEKKNNKIEKKLSASDKAIANLIYLSLDDKEALEYILQVISKMPPLDPKIILLTYLNSYYKKTLKNSATINEFISYLEELRVDDLILDFKKLNPDKITVKTEKIKLRDDSIRQYQKIDIENKIKSVQNDILNKQLTSDEKIEYLKQQLELKKKKLMEV